MKLRMENLNIFGVHWKGRKGVTKNKYRGGDCQKRGGLDSLEKTWRYSDPFQIYSSVYGNSSRLLLFLQDAPSKSISHVWQDSRDTLCIWKRYLVCTYFRFCSDVCRNIKTLFKGLLTHIQNLVDPWHIHTRRYIQNTMLNIFNLLLNTSLFYGYYLTCRVYLRHIQAYSKLIQPYLVMLRHIKSPGIFCFSHVQAYSKRCT